MARQSKKLVIVDAHALIHRAYHALPLSLTSPRGEPIGAVYGFTSVLIKVLGEMRPDYVVTAFDVARPTFRHKEFADYKATRREPDDELQRQVPVVREVLSSFGIPVLEKEGFEADDVIGTVVAKLRGKEEIQTVIVTGDLDTLQLVDGEKTVVYTLRRGMTDTVTYSEEKVRERFNGLGPAQLADYKGLRGDPSDNIPGVPGVGEKTAIALLSEHGSIENLYAQLKRSKSAKGKVRERLLKNRDQAIFSKQLATIRTDVPVSFSLKDAAFTFRVTPQLERHLTSLGFRSLVRRLKSGGAFETEHLRGKEPQNEVERFYAERVLSKKVYTIELSLTPVLRRMEQAGFRIDVKQLKRLSGAFGKELVKIEKKAASLAGGAFNLNSPQEVGRVLFEKLKLGDSRAKKTRTGQYSTAAGELEKIRGEHKIVALILRWRELSKLTSTYLDALPGLIDPSDGRVHTTFRQFGAATGRLSSENPNLQNIPIRGHYGTKVRKAFIAREGYSVLTADYSQMELRIAASLSGDMKMSSAFEKKEDIHARTAAEVFNVPIERVTKDMRRQAKTLNFGVLYGMGPRAFALSAGVGQEEARKFIAEYRADFMELSRFVDEVKEKAKADGYAETLWGRRRPLPELASKNPGIRAAGERMAVNMPIQGTSADITKAAMVELAGAFGDDENVFMVLQVHDELVFEIRKGKEREYGPRIAQIMGGVIELAVPLVVDLASGPSWGELEKISL